ncbi:MAG TPA: IS200/IS605 family transposase [Longimicrobium sp.]|jgi:REP element-mobilizing transposase RayT
MREPYTQLYLHVTWSTWDRLPLITPDRQPVVYASIQQQCSVLGADVLAIGGIEDHVHVLLRFRPTHSISHLVGRMKGASSRVVEQASREPFKWQGAYGAFTVSKRGVPVVRDYVLNQTEHHRSGVLIHALELTSAPPPANPASSR